MKKALSILLSVIIILGIFTVFPATVMGAEVKKASVSAQSGDFKYAILKDGTAEITGYTGSATDLAISSELDGYTVTSLGYNAFSGCTSLERVIIPDSVTSIEDSAFYKCTSLESITIPDGVTRIDDEAFYKCTSLKNITIPDGVTRIGYWAFSYCTNLTSIAISDSVTGIDDEAFYGCTSLKSIAVDENNTEYSSLDGNLYNNNKSELIQYAIGKTATSFSIPNSVTSIGEDAFYGCTSLENITIPDSVTSIGECAFTDCSSLKSITIPDSVASIGIGVFYGCTSLESITIPDSVKKIGYSAFSNTAYYRDNDNWENDVLYIGKHLIKARDSIKGSYSIKTGTITIADCAFEDCTSLTSVTIPDSVISIGYGAFRGCTSLKDVYYGGTKKQWNKIIISYYNNCLTNAVIHCKDGTIIKTVITLKKSSATVYKTGKVTIKATVKNSNDTTAFKSSNTKIAKVSSKGVVTAVKVGTAKITVANNGVKKTFTVTVKNPKLNKKNVTLKKNQSFTLNITGKVGTPKFTSSNKNVTTVSKNGKITAKKKGSAVITVKTNGIFLKCAVKVN